MVAIFWFQFAISFPVVLCAYILNQSFVAHTVPIGDSKINSAQRKNNRYIRRIRRRELKRKEKIKDYDSFDKIFTYSMLYKSYKKCVRGIGWKARTQMFSLFSPMEVYKNYRKLHNGTFKRDPLFKFIINDRGKEREIKSVSLRERNVQWNLCDNSLSPIIRRTFIYDNGATLKGKGYSFSINRLKTHLIKYVRKYGTDGYILLFDFSKFFDSIPHNKIKEILDKTYSDNRIKNLLIHFMDAYGDVGLGLGSPINQVFALSIGNRLDHLIKDFYRIKYYGRYMDDGYIIHHNKKFLLDILDNLIKICGECGISLNRRKTKICKINKTFPYLKVRFFVTKTGKIIQKIYKKSITRMRRKLKKFSVFVNNKKFEVRDVIESLTSWIGYAKAYNSHNTIKSIIHLFSNTFGVTKNLYRAFHL